MKYYIGTGFVNTMINKLPIELHIPGYNYCGPGTKLEARLKRGDRGVNALDESCKQHDIAYSNSKDLEARHKADNKLAKEALTVVKSQKATIGERLSALGVAGAMKAKVKLGMGVKNNNIMSGNNKNEVIKKCLQLMQKVKQSMKSFQNDVDKSITALQKETGKPATTAISRATTKSKKSYSKPKGPCLKQKKSSSLQKIKKQKVNEIEMMDIDPSPSLEQQQQLLQPLQEDDDTKRKIAVSRKRKNENNHDPSIKLPKLDLNRPIIYSARKRKMSSDNDDDGGGENISIEKKQRIV